MKTKLHNTIGFKVIIIYIGLAIINIAFFISIIFENQIDLITENSKHEGEKLVGAIVGNLKKFSAEWKSGTMFKAGTQKQVMAEIDKILKPVIKDYIIFSETGEKLLRSNKELKMPESYLRDGMKAVANQDFTGKEYFMKLNQDSYAMYFYVPLKGYQLNRGILFVYYDIQTIGDNLSSLYRQAVVILILTTVFHVIFGVLLFRIIIIPLRQLHGQSRNISEGDLSSRVEIKSSDEIGELALSFNDMADSIQQKVDQLQDMNQELSKTNKSLEDAQLIMKTDIQMASNVQSKFFLSHPPTAPEWDISFIFRPVSEVSGDLFDFYEKDGVLVGAALFDVSGHGVASGLITLLAKSIIYRHFEIGAEKKLGDVMEGINDELIEEIGAVDNYLTGMLIRIKGNVVEFANAAHQDIILKKSGSGSCHVIDPDREDAHGMFLGMEDMAFPYKSFKFKVEKGDAMLIYTDCLNETMNTEGKQYDVDGILNSFTAIPDGTSADEMLTTLVNGLYTYVGSEDVLDDDLTALLLKKK